MKGGGGGGGVPKVDWMLVGVHRRLNALRLGSLPACPLPFSLDSSSPSVFLSVFGTCAPLSLSLLAGCLSVSEIFSSVPRARYDQWYARARISVVWCWSGLTIMVGGV